MSYAGSGTSTPVLELPEGTFSDEDREIADEWSEAFPGWDYSDSDHIGGTRADRRAALYGEVGDAADFVTNPIASALPWWAKYAAAGGLLLVLAIALRPYASIGAGVVGG